MDIPTKQVTLRYNAAQLDLARVNDVFTEGGYPVASTDPA